ncbi:ribosome biogenesis protein NOP53 [Varanus komodoensis]|uniref:ribosome biogenesis protein NOP53 n=1 Tax=Varanus komodoensis TaxID=61221 RepID=UPI001CF79DEB|nr:ribosome biogenesis protein NOP53 [Varanus komodoensis]
MAEPAGEASLAAPEASSSFLGFGPNSREPGRLPSRRAGGKGARHRKKGWKRWRGPEVQLGRELGDWLEERAAELRHAGGLLSEKPDESLFFVDKVKGQNEKHAKEKPLRIDLILQPDSKVPPPKDILAHQIPNGRKQKQKQRLWEKLAEKGVMPRKERLLQERLQKAPALKADSEEASTALNPSRSFYDIWSDLNPLDKALAGKDSWFLEQTKKQPVKRPERLKKTPSQLPAVEVISPGGSYNPSFQSHQALLLQAHEIEVKRQKEAERLERQLRFPTAAEAPTQETVFREQCEGLLEDESDGEEGQDCPPRPPEVELQADAPTSHFPQAVAGEKKTERQRKKEKEAKQLKARERSAKAARLRRQELFQLRSIRLQVKRREAELQRRKQAREAKRKEEANAGAVQYEDPDLDVQLSTELAESLRTLKPEGSILRDRFKSLQKRNLIEPRERAKFKRKYRLKYVEKRAFREIT